MINNQFETRNQSFEPTNMTTSNQISAKWRSKFLIFKNLYSQWMEPSIFQKYTCTEIPLLSQDISSNMTEIYYPVKRIWIWNSRDRCFKYQPHSIMIIAQIYHSHWVTVSNYPIALIWLPSYPSKTLEMTHTRCWLFRKMI